VAEQPSSKSLIDKLGVKPGARISLVGVDDLARLAELEPYLSRNGAVWAVFPKGRRDLREMDVIGAGLGARLVDNKVVRFSETHTALRFVIPVARR
jgi:hypothetical protein